ncbi:MAG: hypothetical protein EPN55_13665 [Gammaproteobacteria bacterium]|nr:MAG: hypothetical protein EPN55_13665 [Gammaproteobacteria bacterium]
MLLRRFFMSAALLAASFLVAPTVSVAAEAVAMVTDRQGKVQIVEGARARPLALLDYLRPDTELKLARGASVTLVYFSSGTQYMLSGEGGARIQADKPAPQGSVTVSSNAMRQGALVANARKETAQGALVMKTAPQPIWGLSPSDGKILETRPAFHWESKRVKPPYRVTLNDASGARVAEGEVKGTNYSLPSNVSLHEGVRYTWRVEGHVGKATEGNEASFEIATAAERDQINQARPAAGASFSERVTYATILDGMGFRNDARKVWRQLAAERKGDIRLRVRANKEH